MPDIATMTTTEPSRFDLLRLLDPAAVAAGIVRDLLADVAKALDKGKDGG